MARRAVSTGAAQSRRSSRTKKSGIFFLPKTKTAWLTMLLALGCCCLCFNPASTASWLVSAEPMTATAASSHTASSSSSQQNDDVTVRGGSGSSSEKDTAKDKTGSLALEVTELNSRNFDSLVSDGNVWLVEFYSPGCGHCKSFASSYENIAAAFHSSPQEHIRVGKVDASVERALTARFGIQYLPSFYLISGWSVYPFEDARSVHNLMDFARGGYKKEEQIPWYMSPMGPLGLLQGAFVYCGAKLYDVFGWLNTAYGVSPILASMALCGVAIFGGLVSIVLFTILTTPSDYSSRDSKQD